MKLNFKKLMVEDSIDNFIERDLSEQVGKMNAEEFKKD